MYIKKHAASAGFEIVWGFFRYLPGQHKQFLLELFSFPLQLCFKAPVVHLQNSSPLFCHLQSNKKKSSLPSAAFLSSDFFVVVLGQKQHS